MLLLYKLHASFQVIAFRIGWPSLILVSFDSMPALNSKDRAIYICIHLFKKQQRSEAWRANTKLNVLQHAIPFSQVQFRSHFLSSSLENPAHLQDGSQVGHSIESWSQPLYQVWFLNRSNRAPSRLTNTPRFPSGSSGWEAAAPHAAPWGLAPQLRDKTGGEIDVGKTPSGASTGQGCLFIFFYKTFLWTQGKKKKKKPIDWVGFFSREYWWWSSWFSLSSLF